MDSKEHATPQKLQYSTFLNEGSASTPNRKCISTSKRPMSSPNTKTYCNNGGTYTVSGFSTLSQTTMLTPPAKRFQRVRNPFEAALAERLHLPLIGSPSLFQRPATPQLSSTQFEWTIDEVSSLKPMHVEPHETQFQDSPDPELEAKAQSAISSYFKEHKIVPSPIDCPLRKQRIILSELNGSTPITKAGLRIRDVAVQTELSLPYHLPKELEDALRPYFRTDNNENDVNSISSFTSEAKDVSLRRKLFDIHNVIVVDEDAILTLSKKDEDEAIQQNVVQQKAIIGKLSDSTDKSSICSLSPISATDGLSFSSNSSEATSTRCRFKIQNFLNDFEEMEQLSPIRPTPIDDVAIHSNLLKNSISERISKEKYRNQENSDAHNFTDFSISSDARLKFSPEQSSSPMGCLNDETEIMNESSFNLRVSRMAVSGRKSKDLIKNSNFDMDMISPERSDELDDICNQQNISATSTSSSNSNTPRSKPRSASRKNLSQSFSAVSWSENENDSFELCQLKEMELDKLDLGKENVSEAEQVIKTNAIAKNSTFYRTDSGFNEMTCSSGSQPDESHNRDMNGKTCAYQMQSCQGEDLDISMGCCSTPSKQTAA